MKKTILLCLIALCSISAEAQVDNYAIRLEQGGSVDCGPMPELNGCDNYTIQFWMNAKQWTTGATLLQRGPGLRIWMSGDKTLTATVGSQQIVVNNTLLTTGKWNHIMLLSNGENLNFYINGSKVKTLSAASPIPVDDESSFLIGGDTYEGRLDEIRVWNTELSSDFDYFVNNTLNKWVPQLQNLVAYFKGDQELCPNLVDYKPLFDPTAESNHHGIFSATGARLEKVTDNTGLPYLLNGAYTENTRFFDRAIDRDKYLLSNDLIILGIDSYSDGHLEYTSANDHGTVEGAEYLAEFEGRQGVLALKGQGTRMTLPKTVFNPTLTNGVANQGYTFETWIYLDEWTEGAYLFRRETDDGQHGFSISLGDESRKAIVVKVNGNRFVNKSKLETGKWMHLGISTFQGGSTRNTFVFALDGVGTFAAESQSDTSTDYTPTGMDNCLAYIGEGLKAKLDETLIWDQKFSAEEMKSHMNSVPFPGIGVKQTAQLIMKGMGFYRYDNPEDMGYDYYSQDEWRRIMLSAYEGYRGYQVRISVRGHDNWQSTIANANRRKIFAADLARLSEGYDGVELDLEWMDGTQTNLGLLADEIVAALPKGKTLMISCHAYGAYMFPKAKIAEVDGFTFQQYGPQTTFFTFNNFNSSYNNFLNYGFPKDKIYLSYSTTTSQGSGSSGTAAVVGVRNGFLDGDYQPSFTADVESFTLNGNTYKFMGPGQVYRRAKFCVENNLQGIFYWDMGNDVSTSHPYSMPKYCAYALNSNVDTLVTEVEVKYPTGIGTISSEQTAFNLRFDDQHLTVEIPTGAFISRLDLYAPSGKCVRTGRGRSLETASLPHGVYLLRISLQDGKTVLRKFIKK